MPNGTPIKAILDNLDTSFSAVQEMSVARAATAIAQTDTSFTEIQEYNFVKPVRAHLSYLDASFAKCEGNAVRAISAEIESDTSYLEGGFLHVQRLKAEIESDTSFAEIGFVARRFPMMTPTGSINVTTATGIKPLDKSTFLLGFTHTFNFVIEGERLTGIGVQFRAVPHNNDTAATIFKSSDPRVGGIYLSDEVPINGESGPMYRIQGAIEVYPSDTAEVMHPTLYYYDWKMSGSLVESFPLESGKFLMTPAGQER